MLDPTRPPEQRPPYSMALRILIVVVNSAILIAAGVAFATCDPPAPVPEHPQPWEVVTPPRTGATAP